MDQEDLLYVFLRPSWMNRQQGDTDTLLFFKWENFITKEGDITPQFEPWYFGRMKRTNIFPILEKVGNIAYAGFSVNANPEHIGKKNKQFLDPNPDFESEEWQAEYCLQNAPLPTEQVIAFIYSEQHQSVYAVRCRWRPELTTRGTPGFPAPITLFFERVQYPILINKKIWPTKPIHSDRNPDNHPLIIGDVLCIHNQYYRIRADKPTRLHPASEQEGVLPGLKLTRVLAHEITEGEEES